MHTRRPEDRYHHHIASPPVCDYNLIAKSHEAPEDLAPAGPAFPRDIGVCILTLNEHVNIGRAINSVIGSGQVIVVDCGSTDGTVQIAESLGAIVLYHPFTTSAQQRQWALQNAGFTTQWVLMLDADEWVPTNLARELYTIASTYPAGELGGVWLRTRFVYGGRWIPRASLYPSWQMRFMNKDRAHYEPRAINAHSLTDASSTTAEADLIHEDLKSLSARVHKIERYARLEAIETSCYLDDLPLALKRALNRRRRLKVMISILPVRASVLALIRLLRGAWREGRSGMLFVEDVFFQERLTRRYVREVRHQRTHNIRCPCEPDP